MADRREDKGVALLIDDEPDLLESYARILADEGYRPVTAGECGDLAALCQEHQPDVVVTDLKMPKKDGMAALKELKEQFPNLPVVMISAYATVEGVVAAVKEGAFDYLTKPFSAGQLVITVDRAVNQARLSEENRALRARLRDDYFGHSFVGKSQAMKRVVEFIRKVAKGDANVVISGEPGVGKRAAAQAIHLCSRRADQPFSVVDCAAINGDRDEGDGEREKELVAQAAGGTLYLDGVDLLNPSCQTRLLDQLRQSSNGKEPVRVVASVKQRFLPLSLGGSAKEGFFYYVNVVSLPLPPLRERTEDIPLLCELFLEEAAKNNAAPALGLTGGALAALTGYGWPGNVRELKKVVQSGAALASGDKVTAADLPPSIRAGAGQRVNYKEAKKEWLQNFEKNYLENLLTRSDGNISRASQAAGVARMSLYRMLKRNNLLHGAEEKPGKKKKGRKKQ